MLTASTRLGATAPFTASQAQPSVLPPLVRVLPPVLAQIFPGSGGPTPKIRERKTRLGEGASSDHRPSWATGPQGQSEKWPPPRTCPPSKTRPTVPLLPCLPGLRMSSQLLAVNTEIVPHRFSTPGKTRPDRSLLPLQAACGHQGHDLVARRFPQSFLFEFAGASSASPRCGVAPRARFPGLVARGDGAGWLCAERSELEGDKICRNSVGWPPNRIILTRVALKSMAMEMEFRTRRAL